MNVTVNGEARELRAGATVASVVEMLDVTPGARGVAVALDGEVVSRGRWADTLLSEGSGGNGNRQQNESSSRPQIKSPQASRSRPGKTCSTHHRQITRSGPAQGWV